MKQADYIRIKEETKHGPVFAVYKTWLKEKADSGVKNLISSEPASTNEHEQIIGELRVLSSHFDEFQNWIDEKIRTTTNE